MNKQDYNNFQVGDWVTKEYWREYLEIVEVEGRRIKIQEEDCTAWYDTHDHNFTKKGDVMKTEVKVTNAVADEFRVGDIVWCLLWGKGKVTHVARIGVSYPVEVSFDNGESYWYTLDGGYLDYSKRTLFFSEPKVEASVTRPFVPSLVGKTVVVKTKRKFMEVVTVHVETADKLYTSSDGDFWCKSDLEAVYEISSDNILKP